MVGDGYVAEQSSPGTPGRGMDADVIPWLRDAWNVDTTISEFPYFQYAGAEDSHVVREWLNQYGATSVWTLPDHLRESATYRTDLVGVRVDYRRLHERTRLVGHAESMITGEGWGDSQPLLRTYLNIRRDGPMTPREYVMEHGLRGEPNAMPEPARRRSINTLARRGFLHPTEDTEDGGGGLVAGFGTLFGAVHAVELKRERGEWGTALEQAARADVYADYLWVVMSEGSADLALQNTECFQSEGVGLATTTPREDVTVHVPAEYQPVPGESSDILSRPHCERWNLNERTLDRLET